ncbi:MAG: molybdenum cofactor biosynthesis protein [Anaerolineaceae bacterium]|nr:molybdenum cofactor biosynthesis protein [Anaerolineaceae bacterium]
MNICILTISDRSSKGVRDDLSGPAILNKIESLGWNSVGYEIIPDEINIIRDQLIQWCDEIVPDIIFTTGGTGFAPRDVTPEATEKVIDKKTPGISEYIRLQSMKITPHAMLSRGIAGIRKKTLIINLPGSPKAALESIDFILPALPHAVELIHNDPKSESNH